MPATVRGTIHQSPMHLADLYTTFAAVAGISDPTDHSAATAGLPALDGFNFWPQLSGANSTCPRVELYGGPSFFIAGDYKLMTSSAEVYAVWTGPISPNATTSRMSGGQYFLQWNCTSCNPPVINGRINCSLGCLYNVAEDPAETKELSAQEPRILAAMRQRFAELQQSNFEPDRGSVDPRACELATTLYADSGGCFWGPFAFINGTQQ